MFAEIPQNSFDLHQSPYASILHTNYAPSAAELAELQTLILAPQQTLSGLESEISHLQLLLNKCSSERDRVKSYIDAHRALMSPIRQLPAETLAEIFVNCLPTERYPVRSLDEAPLILNTICRSWREIAINTPRLWNSLHIYIPSLMPIEALARREQGVRLWLSRSGSLPLSFSLTIDYLDFFESGSSRESRYAESRAAFFRSLLNFSHRFDAIALDLSLEDWSVVTSLLKDGLPALRSFFVQRGRGDYTQRPGHFALDLPRMPALQRLGILLFAEAQYTASGFEWENLTELVVDSELSSSIGPVSLFTVLQQTTRLESCHVGIKLKGEVAAISSLNVNLPRLHTLSLIFSVATPGVSSEVEVRDVISRVSHILSCPSLQTLSVTLTSMSGISVTKPPFASVLPSLERLRLHVPMTPEALSECLSLASNLLVLEILDVGYPTTDNLQDPARIYDNILKNHHLEALGANDPLCPRLKTFRLWERGSIGTPFSRLELLGFLESKQRGAHKLELCDVVLSAVRGNRDLSDEVLQRFRHLQENGLKLRIRQNKRFQNPQIEDTPISGLDRLVPSSKIIAPLDYLQDRSYGAFDITTVIDNR